MWWTKSSSTWGLSSFEQRLWRFARGNSFELSFSIHNFQEDRIAKNGFRNFLEHCWLKYTIPPHISPLVLLFCKMLHTTFFAITLNRRAIFSKYNPCSKTILNKGRNKKMDNFRTLSFKKQIFLQKFTNWVPRGE